MSLQQNIADICRRYDIADLYVFGSRAMEISQAVQGLQAIEFHPASDVDIGILPKKMKAWSPGQRVQLSIELEDLLQVGRIDLILLPEADPFLALDIIKGELLYTDDPDRQARHELFVLRRAGDLLPFKKERIRLIFEEGAR
ncbi:MAG: nucleotidyltransferase domain-containing protein [Desulfohalobiaceae bacterium]|nr:nucleotidyltransferase domain-containing protein [Desulfohalobiaceae bacterium]